MRRIALLCLGAVACAAASPTGVGPGPARRHRRAALHELGAEHPVVRVARDLGRRTPTGSATTTTRTTRSRPSPVVNYADAGSGLELGELERRGDAAARRPVRRLRAGPVLVPERLAVDLRRPELVLDGHDARAPRVHDDRPLQADGGAARSRAARRTSRTRRSRCGSTSPTTSPARSRPTSSASRSAAGRRTCATTNAGLRSTATTRPARSRAAPARRPRSPAPPTTATVAGRERVGVRDRRRRLDPRQPERPQPERRRPTRPTCPTPSCDGVVLDRTPPTVAIGVGLDVGQGRRPRVARRRRPRTPRRAWPAPASGRGATTPAAASGDAVTHTYTQAGHLRGRADRHRRGGQRGDGEEDDHGARPAGGGGDDATPPDGGGGTTNAAAAAAVARPRRPAAAAATTPAGATPAAATTPPRRRRRAAHARARRPAQRPRPRQVDPGRAHRERRRPRPAHARRAATRVVARAERQARRATAPPTTA